MTHEQDRAGSAIRSHAWDLAVSTLAAEALALACCGAGALVLRLLGRSSDVSFLLSLPILFAVRPTAELYRSRPPQRLAALAAFLITLTVTLLLGIAAEWAFPPLGDDDIGLLAGFLVGAPVGAAAFAALSDRASTA